MVGALVTPDTFPRVTSALAAAFVAATSDAETDAVLELGFLAHDALTPRGAPNRTADDPRDDAVVCAAKMGYANALACYTAQRATYARSTQTPHLFETLNRRAAAATTRTSQNNTDTDVLRSESVALLRALQSREAPGSAQHKWYGVLAAMRENQPVVWCLKTRRALSVVQAATFAAFDAPEATAAVLTGGRGEYTGEAVPVRKPGDRALALDVLSDLCNALGVN